MTNDVQDDLLSRFETATEGSQELNALIWEATDFPAARRCYWSAAAGMPTELTILPKKGLGWRMVELRAPHYTTSFEAALTLLPEGWIVTELCQRIRSPVWHWYCALSYLSVKSESFDIRPDAEAVTPALALCAVVFKIQDNG